MIHKTRNGKPIECYPCQQNEHDQCMEDGLDGTLKCHCKTCSPAPCEECFPPPKDGQHRKGKFCTECFTQLPLTGTECPFCGAEIGREDASRVRSG